MKTKFIKDVMCLDEYADSRPDKAIINLDERLAKRILCLHKAVKRLGVYRISEFEYTPNWVETGVKEPNWHVDCVVMNVTDVGVHWEAFIKHTTITLETGTINIKSITKKFPGLQAKKWRTK